MNFLKLTNEKLDIGAICDLVANESCGAISMFAGTTRDSFEDKKVVCLEYEAYNTMTIKVMTDICNEIRSKWPDVKHIAMYHRLEVVPVKEASVVIAISSPHRQSSLQSVEFAIDELKRLVPIWKKEQYENNSADWKANKECKGKLKIRQLINFDECKIELEPVPDNLIQIKANDSEIKRRINHFIEKKRNEININNILDFTTNNIYSSKLNENNDEISSSDETSSCARHSSVFVKRNNSKGHLRVSRVKNEIGPNDHKHYKQTLVKLMDNLENKHKTLTTEFKNTTLPIAISERIENIEKYLNINTSVPKSIYDRIKIMEDKISYLESVSPEYRHFVSSTKVTNDSSAQVQTNSKKKKYETDEINYYINALKDKIAKKVKTEEN